MTLRLRVSSMVKAVRSQSQEAGGAVPVAGGTETAELLQDDAAVLVRPVPGVAQELVAGQIGLLDALLCQLIHHLGLGGDGSVVGAGHPAGVLALHAGAAHQNILYGIVQHVAHVEHTRHVGGRDDNGVRLAAIGFGTEKVVIQPVLVPFSLHIGGVVFAC